MERQEGAMEKKVSLSLLLAFYGDMLTDTQREMARLHWEEDLTLSEIAGQFSVSRQSVHDTVSRTEKQLVGLEEKLHLRSRFQRTEDGLHKTLEKLQQVKAAGGTESYLQSALDTLRALLDQEEQ
jgi:hypothetical protein